MKNATRFFALVAIAASSIAALRAAEKPMERDITPGAVSGGAAAARSPGFDPAPAPLHPAVNQRPAPPPPPPDALSLLSAFSKAYADAGSPRVAILYNRTFANNIAAWTMDARAALNLPAAVAARNGFGSETLQWSFEEGFAKPFLAAGVRVVDASLVMQAATRHQKSQEFLHTAEINANEINANVESLRQHTDWLVEVLMVPDARSASGYLFRTTLKRLADGRVLASGISSLEEFRTAPPRTKVVYDETGYKFVPEESPKPTLDDYAQSVAIKLLVDLTPKLAAFSKP